MPKAGAQRAISLSLPSLRLYLLFICFLFTFPVAGKVSYVLSQNCLKARDLIFDLKINQARQLLAWEKRENPANLMPAFLEGQADFLVMLLGVEARDDKAWRRQMDQRLSLFPAGGDAPWASYCRAELLFYRAMHAGREEHYLDMARDLNRVYQLAKENTNTYPDFLPFQKLMALTRVFFGSVPESYDWVKKLLQLDGSVEQGIAALWRVADRSAKEGQWQFLQEESLFMLMLVHLGKTGEKAVINPFFRRLEAAGVQQLAARRPLPAFALASLYLRSGRNEEALRLLGHFPSGGGRIPFYLPTYFHGLALLNKLDTTAASHFRFFIARHKGKNYVKSAWQKLGWIDLIKGDTAGYRRKMNAVLHLGGERGEFDQQAVAEAKRTRLPDVNLLKARLLCDGGYYSLAKGLLLSTRVPSGKDKLHDQLEYNYRLGRVYHDLGETTLAMKHYSMTIEQGASQSWYFAANAAIKMGNIHEENGDKVKALHYYQVVREMKFKEYRGSLQQKAREGIKRVKAGG